MLDNIDDSLVEWYEKKIAHPFQEATGKTCFFLAKWAFLLAASLVSLTEVSFAVLKAPSTTLLLLGAFLIFGMVFWAAKCEKMDRAWRSGPFLNERRNVNKRDRKMALISAVSGAITALPCVLLVALVPFRVVLPMVYILLLSVTYLSGWYLMACTPLPPGKNSARKLWERLLEKTNEVLSPEPEAVPAKN